MDDEMGWDDTLPETDHHCSYCGKDGVHTYISRNAIGPIILCDEHDARFQKALSHAEYWRVEHGSGTDKPTLKRVRRALS